MNSQDLMQYLRSSVQDAGSWLEIDAAAFESNVRNLLSKIDDRALLCAVVKSHAYGHGADLLLPSLVRLGVPFVGVGSNEEAAIARRCGFEGGSCVSVPRRRRRSRPACGTTSKNLLPTRRAGGKYTRSLPRPGRWSASTSISTFPGSAGTASTSHSRLAGHPR